MSTRNKKPLSEQDTCRFLITPALHAAGWNDAAQIREEVSIVSGRVHVSGERFSRGSVKRADYVLYKQPNQPIAVIEIKSGARAPSDGIHQALMYAEMLDVPFAYSSNGEEFIERDRAAHSHGREISLQAFPSPLELWARYCRWKGLDADGAPENIARRTGETIIRLAMREYATLLAERPEELVMVEWRDLERILREVFERLGFETTLTRSGKDGGFDLELVTEEDGERATYLVEVKHWAEPCRPGNGVLKDFLEVVVGRSATRGLLLSTSGFTTGVFSGVTEFQRRRVRLGNGQKIISLCKAYHKLASGIWTTLHPLPQLLFGETL